MAVPLEDHVRQVLLENERGVKLHGAVVQGWAAASEYPQRGRWRRKSTMRHIVWEEIVQRLIQVAVDDPHIVPIEHQDTVSLIIEDEVLFRLKYADTALVTANYPTPEAQLFDHHEVDLYGFAGLQRVKLCYVPDEHETNLLWAGIAASNHGRFLWKIELDGAGAVAAVPRLPFTEPQADPSRIARLRPASGAKGAEKKKGNDG